MIGYTMNKYEIFRRKLIQKVAGPKVASGR
jgi:hypothetical protein